MKEYLTKLPTQIKEGWAIGERMQIQQSFKDINKILFCGMGGSAIGSDIFRVLSFQNTRFPFMVQRSPQVPKWVDSETLVVLLSYSGNTREILESIDALLKVKAQMIVLTSGGKLQKIAQKHGISCIEIPAGLPPRCAIGYLTFSLLPIFQRYGWLYIPEHEIKEVMQICQQVPHEFIKKTARHMKDKLVRIYAGAGLMEPAAIRWQTQLAENAKALASHHFFPEAFHNDIQAWRFPKEIAKRTMAVFILDRGDPDWIQKKVPAAQKMIRQSGAQVMQITSKGVSPLARIFSMIVFGDWLSYELSLLYRVDPLGIPAIESLKK